MTARRCPHCGFPVPGCRVECADPYGCRDRCSARYRFLRGLLKRLYPILFAQKEREA